MNRSCRVIIARERQEGCEVAPKAKQKLVMQMRNFDGEGGTEEGWVFITNIITTLIALTPL